MPRTRTNEHTPTRAAQRRRPGRGRPWSVVLVVTACLVLAGALSSCGQEDARGDTASLSERAENDVPLNPPTLRFHVSEDGEVDASPDREAEAGEAVAIVLENESDVSYELRLLDPEGDDVFAVDATAGGRGDGRAMPREVGTHLVEVYPRDEPGASVEFPVEVSEN